MHKYILDTNSFITPARDYYRFTLAPSFWEQLNKHAENGNILIIKSIRDELLSGIDEEEPDLLQRWIIDDFKGQIIDHESDADIINGYSRIINFLKNSELYTTAAMDSWSDIKVADAWIIACAKVHDLRICTLEVPKGLPNKDRPSSKPKIPNIADKFEVPHCSIFDMMEDLKIVL